MSKGWAIGSQEFKRALMEDHQVAANALPHRDRETENISSLIWDKTLTGLL